MKLHRSPTIIVLGAHGMLGHTVYNFLKNTYLSNTWGTVRKRKDKDNHLLYFDAYKLKDLEIIIKNLKKTDYIINCIGILSENSSKEEINFINAIFPHNLALLAEKYNAKLIHISSDAVFHPLSGKVDEQSPTSPSNSYGQAKLKGEPVSSNAITIRTSIIGLDPYSHKGVLEWALKAEKIIGFTNQLWSGCTTLQFAMLCYLIINTNSFQKMRDKSSIFHFSPISNITKHDIIKTFLSLQNSNKLVRRSESNPVTRLLKTKYSNLLFFDKQKMNIKNVLEDLINYERKIQV